MAEENEKCPKCESLYGYKDGNIWICPQCFYEWSQSASFEATSNESDAPLNYLDANGVQLHNGDTVTTVKDLKVGKETMKSGSKAKNIRLLDEPVDGHDISCKVPGHGSMYLKCSVVKKVN